MSDKCTNSGGGGSKDQALASESELNASVSEELASTETKSTIRNPGAFEPAPLLLPNEKWAPIDPSHVMAVQFAGPFYPIKHASNKIRFLGTFPNYKALINHFDGEDFGPPIYAVNLLDFRVVGKFDAEHPMSTEHPENFEIQQRFASELLEAFSANIDRQNEIWQKDVDEEKTWEEEHGTDENGVPLYDDDFNDEPLQAIAASDKKAEEEHEQKIQEFTKGNPDRRKAYFRQLDPDVKAIHKFPARLLPLNQTHAVVSLASHPDDKNVLKENWVFSVYGTESSAFRARAFESDYVIRKFDRRGHFFNCPLGVWTTPDVTRTKEFMKNDHSVHKFAALQELTDGRLEADAVDEQLDKQLAESGAQKAVNGQPTPKDILDKERDFATKEGISVPLKKKDNIKNDHTPTPMMFSTAYDAIASLRKQ